MYRAILVPLDGSPVGEQALQVAADLTRRANATLHLAHVHTHNDTTYVEGMPVIDEQLHSLGRQHEQAYLDQIRDRLTADTPGLSVRCANPDLQDSVARTLTHYAHEHSCDLLVMTTHGRGGLARLWLGSVADALVRASTTPLLLLPPNEGAVAPPLPAGGTLLVPLDGSTVAEQALRPATTLAGLLEAKLLLLSVVRPTVIHGMPLPTGNAGLELELTERHQVAAQQYLAAVASRLHESGIRAETQVMFGEHPARAILEVAQQSGATLIALATHGRSGMQRVILGSVADKVVRSTSIPVLVTRPAGE